MTGTKYRALEKARTGQAMNPSKELSLDPLIIE